MKRGSKQTTRARGRRRRCGEAPGARQAPACKLCKWGLMVGLSLLGTLAGTIPGPLMIFLQVRSAVILRAAVLQRPSAAVVLTLCALCQSQYFNDGKPCITKAETDSQGCKDALSTISFVSGWYGSMCSSSAQLPPRLPSESAALSLSLTL